MIIYAEYSISCDLSKTQNIPIHHLDNACIRDDEHFNYNRQHKKPIEPDRVISKQLHDTKPPVSKNPTQIISAIVRKQQPQHKQRRSEPTFELHRYNCVHSRRRDSTIREGEVRLFSTCPSREKVVDCCPSSIVVNKPRSLRQHRLEVESVNF